MPGKLIAPRAKYRLAYILQITDNALNRFKPELREILQFLALYSDFGVRVSIFRCLSICPSLPSPLCFLALFHYFSSFTIYPLCIKIERERGERGKAV